MSSHPEGFKSLILGIAALSVSISAATLTGLQWWESHQSRRLAVESAKQQKADLQEARDAARRSALAAEESLELNRRGVAAAEESARAAKESATYVGVSAQAAQDIARISDQAAKDSAKYNSRLVSASEANTRLVADSMNLNKKTSEDLLKANDRLAKATEQSAHASEQAARASEQTAHASEQTAKASAQYMNAEQAVMVLKPIAKTPHDAVLLEYKNIGRTPATDTGVRCHLFVLDPLLRPVRVPDGYRSYQGNVLVQGGAAREDVCAFSGDGEAALKDAVAKKYWVYLLGGISYKDAFSRVHDELFCFSWPYTAGSLTYEPYRCEAK